MKKAVTWRIWMEKYLTDRGLWPQEAFQIANNAAINNDALGEIIDRSHAGYPAMMNAAVAASLNSEALEWIDANKPKHFARRSFTPGEKP